MIVYLPDYFLKEYLDLRKSNQKIDDFAKSFEDAFSGLDNINPSKFEVEKKGKSEGDRFCVGLDSIIGEMPQNSNLAKVAKIYKATLCSDYNYLSSVAGDQSENKSVRIMAVSGINSLNDSKAESAIKAGEPGTVSLSDISNWSKVGMQVYDSSPEDIKNDSDFKMLYIGWVGRIVENDWYPNGDVSILDKAAQKIRARISNESSGGVLCKADKELSCIASYYYSIGYPDKCIEVCREVLDRKYKYSLNPWKLRCRIYLSLINIDKCNFEDAASELKKNIMDHQEMLTKKDFRSINNRSNKEFNMLIMKMLHTYDILEEIIDRDFKSEKRDLFGDRAKNKKIDNVINSFDIREERHQWADFKVKLNERMSHLQDLKVPYEKYISL